MIELRNITKRYAVHGGERTVLDNINLRTRPGEKIGVLGRNGAGKSTLVRILGGFERPSSGEIFRGRRVSWPLAFKKQSAQTCVIFAQLSPQLICPNIHNLQT